MKKALLTLLKVAVSVGILAYLIASAQSDRSFSEMWAKPKAWGLLAAAALCCSSAVTVTLIRWGYLVRALDLPFPTKDALRLGFLGYLFNLAPLGIVGGDLLKAGMLAWEHPGNKGKAFASVVVDRVIGLYLLFVVASVAIVLTDFWALPVAGIRWVCLITFFVTVAGGVGLVALITPASTDGAIAHALCRLPKIGHHLANSIEALRMYRRRPGVLVNASLMSVAVHSFFATGCWFIFCGLRYEGFSLSTHFVIMPLSAVTGMVPLSIGPFEVALEAFYRAVPTSAGVVIQKGQGLIVALGYRLITLVIAAVGICYYLGSRREVTEVMHTVEEASD